MCFLRIEHSLAVQSTVKNSLSKAGRGPIKHLPYSMSKTTGLDKISLPFYNPKGRILNCEESNKKKKNWKKKTDISPRAQARIQNQLILRSELKAAKPLGYSYVLRVGGKEMWGGWGDAKNLKAAV